MAVFLHPHGKFDNYAKQYSHIEVVPLAAAMGAEIRGLKLGRATAAQIEEIQHALYRHKMVFFRDQHLNHAEHHAFSRQLGEFAQDAYTDGIPGFKEVQPLIKEADDHSSHIFGSGWHTDTPFIDAPPAISTLRAVAIPQIGGDTMWANSALALAMLSDAQRTLISGLKVRFSMRDVVVSAQANAEQRDSPTGRLVAMANSGTLSEAMLDKIRGRAHPLVRTHPHSGEKALYVDPSYAIGIEGMTDAEAAPLLKFLTDHITQPAFTCRLRWSVGTLAMWDNRLCVHQAFNDYDGYRREMYRTTIAGEKPR
jgi:alpha-ketoglutarate-dependent taurine dioxygenase